MPEEYKEEEEKRKLDTSWHKVHDFFKGWMWERYSDDSRITAFKIKSKGIRFEDFPNLPDEEIEKIVEEVNEENEAYRKLPPKKIIIPDSIPVPKYKKKFPDMDIRQLFSENPIMGE